MMVIPSRTPCVQGSAELTKMCTQLVGDVWGHRHSAVQVRTLVVIKFHWQPSFHHRVVDDRDGHSKAYIKCTSTTRMCTQPVGDARG